MSYKLKALCLGILATMAAGAYTAVSATATTGGHFVSEVAHTTIVGSENSTHKLEFVIHGLEGGIVCDEASYSGTSTTETVTQIDLTPTYSKCHTTGAEPGTITIKPNGCIYRLTVAPGSPATTEQTDDLVCPAGVSLEIIHPSCTMRFPAQNNLEGSTYTTTTENGKHAITIDVKKKYTVFFEGGICTLLGTHHTGTTNGSVTVKGLSTAGEAVGVTTT